MSSGERRQYARRPIQLPVKMRCTQTGRLMAGVTRNISPSGAMLEIYQPSMLVSNQRMEIGIGWSSKHSVIGSGDMIKATVVRSLGLGGMIHTAVTFDEPLQQLATTA